MIDYAHKLIFIHIPRTGGTSIVAACGRGQNPDWQLEHASWRFYKANFPDLWQTFTKVAVVRNAISHRRSWYNYHRARFADHMQAQNYEPYALPYREWVSKRPHHEDWKACGILGSPLNQSEFYGPESEGVVLLEFENLAHNWYEFVITHNLPKEWAKLPHLNAS